METGKISKWLFQEGDEVTVGDVVCDIETDKSTVGFEMVDDGFIAKILYPDGSEGIPVGCPVLILVESQDLVKEFQNISVEKFLDSNSSTSGGESSSKPIEKESSPEPEQQKVVETVQKSEIPPAEVKVEKKSFKTQKNGFFTRAYKVINACLVSHNGGWQNFEMAF